MVVCLDSNCRVWHRSALVTSLMTSLVITDLVYTFIPSFGNISTTDCTTVRRVLQLVLHTVVQ